VDADSVMYEVDRLTAEVRRLAVRVAELEAHTEATRYERDALEHRIAELERTAEAAAAVARKVAGDPFIPRGVVEP
jgi:cell division protein FtsB